MNEKNGFAICQNGFEALTRDELTDLRRVKTLGHTVGCVNYTGKLANCVFPHFYANESETLEDQGVKSLAKRLFDYFINTTKDIKFESSWYAVFMDSRNEPGLSRRMKSIKEAFFEILKKRMSRVSKLMLDDVPKKPGDYVGLLVYVTDFNKLNAAVSFHYNGQCRMADDPLAPSRSYLKVEEGYRVLGHSPLQNDLVVDLGAAPGGWSFSAAKRGATVFAIDNGPLKKGALQWDTIIHKKADAFKFVPNTRMDWLFCDLVEEPHHVMQMISQWFANRRCRSFVINFKFGHVNPIKLIAELESSTGMLMPHTDNAKVVHLYHDRDEVTLVGTLKI